MSKNELERSVERYAAEATVEDHLNRMIDLMKRGARVSLDGIPDDPTFLSSHIGGETSKAIAERISSALRQATAMKREEELTVSVKAEDWENACHELIWLVGDTELFERISNAARMNAEQRPISTPKPEAEPVAWRWVWKTTGSPLEQRFADPDLYSWTYRETPPSGEAAKKMVIEPLYSHPQKTNVEPVAWTVQHHLDRIEGTTGSAIIWGKKTSPVDIPLYAHPPKPQPTEGISDGNNVPDYIVQASLDKARQVLEAKEGGTHEKELRKAAEYVVKARHDQRLNLSSAIRALEVALELASEEGFR